MKSVALVVWGMFAVSVGVASAAVGPMTIDLSKGGTVEFHAIGRPSALKIVGKGATPEGKFTLNGNQVTGEAHVALNAFDAGIALRTRHMKEKYLETDKYPEAKFKITKMELPPSVLQGNGSADNIPFKGTLSLHGVENPVDGIAKVERAANTFNVAAQFSLKIADYKITEPKFAGITMADEVQVFIQSSAPLNSTKQ